MATGSRIKCIIPDIAKEFVDLKKYIVHGNFDSNLVFFASRNDDVVCGSLIHISSRSERYNDGDNIHQLYLRNVYPNKELEELVVREASVGDSLFFSYFDISPDRFISRIERNRNFLCDRDAGFLVDALTNNRLKVMNNDNGVGINFAFAPDKKMVFDIIKIIMEL